MKTKDLKKVREQELSQVLAILANKKKKAALTSVKMAAGKEKNLKSQKYLKKDIAQLLTVITEKEIAERENIKKKND